MSEQIPQGILAGGIGMGSLALCSQWLLTGYVRWVEGTGMSRRMASRHPCLSPDPGDEVASFPASAGTEKPQSVP